MAAARAGARAEYLGDAESYEPEQVTVRRPGNDTSVTTYETFERLPMDAALLQIP
jgi:hypothetical protein